MGTEEVQEKFSGAKMMGQVLSEEWESDSNVPLCNDG